MPGPARLLLTLVLFAVALPAVGCGAGGEPLLSELRLSSQVVAPSGTGEAPPIAVGYFLARPATVSVYLAQASGERLYLRKDEPRPVAGDYLLFFDGAYAPDPKGDERRVLPPGPYQLVVEARDAAGAVQQSGAGVQVRDSDTAPPTVERLALFPEILSPNADGMDDTTKITYRTTKKATVTLFLASDQGKRYVLERQERLLPGEHAATWDGQIGNQLLPSGPYRLLAEARDAAGNVSVAERPLRIDSASVPDAHLIAVDFEPHRVLPGGLVRVEIRVKNTGVTVLRTQGPDPGYTYGTGQVFGSAEGGAFPEKRGLWRVGVDWVAAPGSGGTALGSRYPYRWGFGRDLQPGEETTVTGYIRLPQGQPRIWLHAGLVQEEVRYWDHEVGRTPIEIGR